MFSFAAMRFLALKHRPRLSLPSAMRQIARAEKNDRQLRGMVRAEMSSCVNDLVYLDYAATAPLCEEAASAMQPFFVSGNEGLACNANANTLYGAGRYAFKLMEDARRRIARSIGARKPDEVIFTSGATEADNAAVVGLAHAERRRRRQKGQAATIAHVVVSAIEHDAVLAPCKRLESEGFAVTYLSPNRHGFVGVDALLSALTPDTVLVSVQTANSEIGSVQPVRQLAEASHRAGALFHTDAVQAFGKIPFDVQKLGIDAACLSSHKIGGPKGVGLLYLRSRTPFEPFLLGGGQEGGRRSGTQNVAGIVGFAAACEAAVSQQEAQARRLRVLRERIYEEVAMTKGVRATVAESAEGERWLDNIVHLLSDELESETMILRFDELGVCVSGGSACASHSLAPSHVLRAMGISDDAAHRALRVSLGRSTTEADVDAFLRALHKVLCW